MRMLHFVAGVLAVIASVGANAQTPVVGGQEPERLAKLISDKGYRAEFVDTGGLPRIRSQDSGVNFVIFFMNCTEDKNCSTVQFYTGFASGAIPLDKVNRWNGENRFGRAYLDESSDPVLEMDINLDSGGVTADNFLDSFTIWLDLMSKFRTFVTENTPPAPAE